MWSALRRDGSSRSIYRDRNPSSGSSSHQQHQRRSNSRDRSLGTLTKNQPFSIIVLALYILHFKSQKKQPSATSITLQSSLSLQLLSEYHFEIAPASFKQ